MFNVSIHIKHWKENSKAQVTFKRWPHLSVISENMNATKQNIILTHNNMP